jgi:hypothetical protein
MVEEEHGRYVLTEDMRFQIAKLDLQPGDGGCRAHYRGSASAQAAMTIYTDFDCPHCGKETDLDPLDWSVLNLETYTCKHCGAVLNVDGASHWDEDMEESFPTVTLTVRTPPP